MTQIDNTVHFESVLWVIYYLIISMVSFCLLVLLKVKIKFLTFLLFSWKFLENLLVMCGLGHLKSNVRFLTHHHVV
jgi:hypothetical protein